MLERDFVREQVRRLSGLSFFPSELEALGEIINALREAPDEGAAKQFVTDWLRSNPEAPKPAEIYSHFDGAKPPAPLEVRKDPECSICGDTGWEIVHRGGLTGARKCSCRAATESTGAA